MRHRLIIAAAMLGLAYGITQGLAEAATATITLIWR